MMIFSAYTISFIFSIIIISYFLRFIYKLKRKTKEIKTLIVVLSLVNIWFVANFIGFHISLGSVIDVFLWRFVFLIAANFSIFILKFVVNFVKISVKSIIKKIIFLSYLSLWFVTLFTDFVMMENVDKASIGISDYIRGDLFWLLILFIVFPLFLSLIILLKKILISKNNITKIRLKYVFFALIIPAVLGIFTDVVLPILGVNIFHMAHLTIVLTVLIFSFGIYHVGLFGIKIKTTHLSTKIFASLFVFGIVTFSSTILFFYIFLIPEMKKQSSILLEGRAKVQYEISSAFLSQKQWKANVLSNDNVFNEILLLGVNSSDYSQKRDYIAKKFLHYKYDFENLWLTDTNNFVIASSDKSDLYKKFDFVNLSLKTEIYFFNKNSLNKEKIIISIPIKKDKIYKGSLIVSLYDNEVQEFFETFTDKTNLPSGTEVYILDEHSNLVRSTNELAFQAPREIWRDSGIYKCYGESNNTNLINFRGEEVISSHFVLPEIKMCFLYEQPNRFAFSKVNKLFGILSFISAVILFIFYFIAKWLGRKITAPLKTLEQGILHIEQGYLDYSVNVDTNDEIGVLADSFNRLIFWIRGSKKKVDRLVKQQTKKIIKNKNDLENQQKAMLNILEDIAEEKDKAQVLAKDLEKFKLAVEQTSEHVVITDPDGMILYANKAVETITGFDRKEVLGKKAGESNLWGGLMGEDFYKKLWKTIKIGKKPFGGEVTNKRKDGSKYIADVHISPIVNKDGKVIFFVGLERDITRSKEVDRMKTEFISLASHQLRTPLSAMNWMLEMLLDQDAGKLTQEQHELIDNINQSNERMIALVNGLLNISRIESGRMMVDPKQTDLKKLIADVIHDVSAKIKIKKHDISVEFGSYIPKIKIDPKLVRQIYMNILTNAIKYTPEGGKIRINISSKDKFIVSSISDNGWGIPKRDQKNVFDKFFRSANIVKHETDGTGLGLYLVELITKASGGKVWFESKENVGTTFWFSLPKKGSKSQKGEVTIDT